MDNSFSKRSVHSEDALGGRQAVQTRNGLELGKDTSAQIVLILEISRPCRRFTFSDCLANKTIPPPHLSCVSERSFRIKV